MNVSFFKKLPNYCQHFVLSQFILTVLIPHHSLNLQFLVATDVEHFFTCLSANCMSSLVTSLFMSFCPFSNWIFWVLLLNLGSSLCILDICCFYRYVVYRYLLPVCSLFLRSFHRTFCRVKVINFVQV